MANKFWVPLAISAIANNGSGFCRCTVSSTTNLSTTCFLFGMTGTTGLNGQQTISIISGTTFDVVAVAFVATGTGSVNGQWTSTNTANWSASTGGAGGAAIPGTGDVALFDGSSGTNGTVVVGTTINGSNTVNAITFGAFPGTLDFSVNNPSITTGFFNVTGTGARTVHMGSSVITITGLASNVFDASVTSSLVWDAGTGTFQFSDGGSFGVQATMVTGGLLYATVIFNGRAFATNYNISGAGATFGTLTLTAGAAGPLAIAIPACTITNAINWAGTNTNLIEINNSTAGTATSITLSAAGGTIQWAAIRGITFVTNSVTATNSFDMKNVTNATITNPSAAGSGGGGIIGQ